jgi:hypothetical protein
MAAELATSELPVSGPVDGVVYTPTETCNFFIRTVTPTALLKQAQAGKVPCTRVGREIGFTAENIRAIIAAAQHDAKAEKAAPARRSTPRPLLPLPATAAPSTHTPGRRPRVPLSS